MRKRGLFASLVTNLIAGFLLFMAGAVTGRLASSQIRVAPITIPLHAPKFPPTKSGDRAPRPLSRRAIAPALVKVPSRHPFTLS